MEGISIILVLMGGPQRSLFQHHFSWNPQINIEKKKSILKKQITRKINRKYLVINSM